MEDEPKYYQLYGILVDLLNITEQGGLFDDYKTTWDDLDLEKKKRLRIACKNFLEECYEFVYTEKSIYEFSDFLYLLYGIPCHSPANTPLINDFDCLWNFAFHRYKELILKSLENAEDNDGRISILNSILSDLPPRNLEELEIMISNEVLYDNPSEEDLCVLEALVSEYKKIKNKISMVRSGIKLQKP